ncbi:MAG: flagellar export protein FliJ [Treponema sp.]|nr:flagellar export protein FliJ [Treponema sp.]
MRAFSFPLQSILTYREYVRSQAETELAAALLAERGIHDKLDEIAQHYISVKQETAGSADFATISAAQQFYALLDSQKEDLLQQLAEAQLVTEQKRAALREAIKHTQSLEKLRERQQAEWEQLELAQESDALDEINTQRRFHR